jgi:xylulokinase
MADSGPYVLAVDLGTSGPKAAVVSLQGRILSAGRARIETMFLPDAGAEQDPESVWDAVKEACGSALSQADINARDVLAVICSSQYSSVIPVDADGQATMNMVVWLDQRGFKKRLQRLDNYPKITDTPFQLLQWIRIHGIGPLPSGLSMQHMRWIKYARPEVYERTATFLEPMDYVAMRFTGRRAANQCTAFMFLVTDNRTLNVTQYDQKLLDYSLLDAEKLPELLPLDAIVGTVLPDVASELGLSPDAKVVTGVNDTQSGGMGTYAFSGGHAAISVGSTSVMITHVDFKRTDVRHAILSMPSPVPDTYFVMAENGIAGGALEHFLENLIYASDHFGELSTGDRFELLGRAVAEAPPGSEGVLFLPWMNGSIAPAEDARMRGGFLNLGMKTTRSHMARAVLEGVALNQRWVRGPVERFTKRSFSHFVYQGGGAESDAWSQIMADVLGAPVHQMEDPQYAPCLGGGLLAFERLGLLSFDDFERLVPIRRIYEPNAANRAVYDEMFGQFVRAFKSVRPIFRTLNRVERDA